MLRNLALYCHVFCRHILLDILTNVHLIQSSKAAQGKGLLKAVVVRAVKVRKEVYEDICER